MQFSSTSDNQKLQYYKKSIITQIRDKVKKWGIFFPNINQSCFEYVANGIFLEVPLDLWR